MWVTLYFHWTALYWAPPIPRVNWEKMIDHSIPIIMGTTTVKLLGDVARGITRPVNVRHHFRQLCF